MTYPNNISWPVEHSDALRAICAEKDIPITRVIAQRLNEMFGSSYSRQSIVGRAHRMKLTLQPKKARQHKATLKQRRDKKAVVLPPMDYANLRTVEVPARHVGLIDLEVGDCRFPYGEGAQTTFCGCRSLEGLPYCSDHMGLTHRETMTPQAVKAIKKLYRSRAA